MDPSKQSSNDMFLIFSISNVLSTISTIYLAAIEPSFINVDLEVLEMQEPITVPNDYIHYLFERRIILLQT